MNRIVAAALLAAAGFSLTCGTETGSGFPEVPGWTPMGEVLSYDADNLWEYINGAAELFVEYGVQLCNTGDLTAGDVTVTVDLYEMGTPLNAYGVYERESSGEPLTMEGAVAAVVSPPYQALMVKGSTYVKVNVFEGELTETLGRELLSAIAQTIQGGVSPPAELGLLPDQGKIPGSEGFKPDAFMGMTELTDCIYAQYGSEGEEAWQGFVVLPDAAGSVWTGLAESWEPLEADWGEVLFTEIPYRDLVGVTRTDRGVFGVSGAADPGALLERLQGFAGPAG